MAIVKFVSDKTCQIFIDKEYSGEVNTDSILKLTLEPGGYLIEVKDKDEHLHKKYNLVINATDNQVLQDVSYGEQSLDDAINQLKNDPLLEFHCNRASFCYNGLYGYINKRFEVVIPAIYTVANKFKDDKAFVVREFTEGKKATLIDEDGNMYFNRWFDYIGESDTTILLGVDNKIIVYSKTKYEKTDEYYNAGYNFKHPLVPVFKKDGVDELYGFIDSDAKEVVPLLYDKVWNFDNSGMAKVFFMGIHGTIDDKSFTLDSNFFSGKVNSINDFVCSELIDSFSFNQTYVSDRVYKTVTPNRIDGKWILNINTYDTYDSSQNEVIQIECEKILFIGEGCCIYRIGNVTHVVYLATGENFVFQVNYLLPANGCIRGSGYDDYYPDTFITRKNGKYGLINKNGNVIFPNVYDYITPIQPNYFVDIYTNLPVFAIMQSGNYFSIANLSDGKIYLPFDFDKIEHINRGLFFRDTLFVLRKSNCYQLFSTNHAILSDEFDELTIGDNNNIVRKGNLYGIIDDYGNEILKPGNYVIERLGDSCLPYEKDYFVIGNNNTYALGDMKTGKILTGQVYNDISILCRGVWIFQVRIGDKLGCINEKGEMVIPIKYDKIEAKTDYWSPWEEKFAVSLYEGNIVSNMDLKKIFE